VTESSSSLEAQAVFAATVSADDDESSRQPGGSLSAEAAIIKGPRVKLLKRRLESSGSV